MIFPLKSNTAYFPFFLWWVMKTEIQTLKQENQMVIHSFISKETKEPNIEHPSILYVFVCSTLHRASWEYPSKAGDSWEVFAPQCTQYADGIVSPAEQTRGANKSSACVLSTGSRTVVEVWGI